MNDPANPAKPHPATVQADIVETLTPATVIFWLRAQAWERITAEPEKARVMAVAINQLASILL